MGLKDACEGSLAWACCSWLCDTLQTWPCWGRGAATTPNQSCSRSSLAWGFACSLFLFSTPLGDRDRRLFAIQTSLRVATSLKSQALPFLHTPTIGISLIWSMLAGLEGQGACVLGACCKGPPPAKTCRRWRAPSPPPKTAAF